MIGSGLATGLGAALVFWNRCIALANRTVLAGCLAVSAGVMLYVSFVEILVKSLDGFSASGLSASTAYLVTTVSFFAGMIIIVLLDVLVRFLDPTAAELTHADENDIPDSERLNADLRREDSSTGYAVFPSGKRFSSSEGDLETDPVNAGDSSTRNGDRTCDAGSTGLSANLPPSGSRLPGVPDPNWDFENARPPAKATGPTTGSGAAAEPNNVPPRVPVEDNNDVESSIGSQTSPANTASGSASASASARATLRGAADSADPEIGAEFGSV